MKIKWIAPVVCILLFMIARPVALLAQATSTPTYTPTYNNQTRQAYATIPYADACSPFNPCGALPWLVPRFATISLPSPTLIEVLQAAPTATGTPQTATPALSATFIGGLMNVDPVSTFSSEIGKIGGTLAVQSTAVIDVGGTPVGVNEIAAGAGASVGGIFAFIRAVQAAVNSMGVLGTLLNFAF